MGHSHFPSFSWFRTIAGHHGTWSACHTLPASPAGRAFCPSAQMGLVGKVRWRPGDSAVMNGGSDSGLRRLFCLSVLACLCVGLSEALQRKLFLCHHSAYSVHVFPQAV